MHKNVSFKDDRSSQLAKSGQQTDRLRILLFKFRHSNAMSDADQDDDDVASSTNGDFNDTNNNKENEKYILIGKRDFPIIFIARQQQQQHHGGDNLATDENNDLMFDDDAATNNDLFHSQLLANNSSLSYGNNLNAIMNLNRNSIKNRSAANSNASSASTTPLNNSNSQKLMMNRNNTGASNNNRFMMHNMMPQAYAHYANTENINYLVVLIGLICLGILFLPLNVSMTQLTASNGSIESRIPIYLHVSIEVKLFASFVMGMIAMVILRA